LINFEVPATGAGAANGDSNVAAAVDTGTVGATIESPLGPHDSDPNSNALGANHAGGDAGRPAAHLMIAAAATMERPVRDLGTTLNNHALGGNVARANAGTPAPAEGDAGEINHPDHVSKTHDEVWALMSLARIYYVTVRWTKMLEPFPICFNVGPTLPDRPSYSTW
jgi:hypothetical protein